MDTFRRVHGAWRDDSYWSLLVAELERRGHQCLAPLLPLGSADATFEDYATVVLECLAGHEPAVLGGSLDGPAEIPLVATRTPVELLVYTCPAMGGLPRRPDEPAYERAGWSPHRSMTRVGADVTEGGPWSWAPRGVSSTLPTVKPLPNAGGPRISTRAYPGHSRWRRRTSPASPALTAASRRPTINGAHANASPLGFGLGPVNVAGANRLRRGGRAVRCGLVSDAVSTQSRSPA
jgi:hypothetical protein